jgi:hypothetical protein
MSRRLGQASEINASPQWVWEVLTDLPAYPQWNPFLLRAEGRVELGRILIVLMQPVGASVPHRAAHRGRGHRGLPVAMEGPTRRARHSEAAHEFRIEALPDGRSRLTQHERFSGLLVPLMARSVDRHTLPAFVAMNAALKERTESSVRSTHRPES